MRKSKVLISTVAVLCAFGTVKEKEAEAKNVFSFFKQDEKPKVETNSVAKPKTIQSIKPAAAPNKLVMNKPAVSAATLTGVNVKPASGVSAKPQVGQIGQADIPRLDTPRGAHIDKGKFEGMADHEGMRDHIPGIGDGAHVAGKDAADAFTGRGDSGIVGADGNSIGLSRSSGLTGADGNAIWDPSGGSNSNASAGTQMTDQYGREFNRGEGGGSGKFITDPHTGERREIGGRSGSGRVSDEDRAAMNERNSIAGDNSRDSGSRGRSWFSIDTRATKKTVVYDGMTLEDTWGMFGDSTTTIRKSENIYARIISGTDKDGNMSIRVDTYDTHSSTRTTVIVVEGQEVVVEDSYVMGPSHPQWVEDLEDAPIPVPEDEEGKPHPDSVGDGGTAGKMHPDSVGGGGIASSQGVDSMGNPDGWFMPHPEDVGGGGIASSEIAEGKAGKPAGDSLDIGGIASSIQDADLRALVLSGKAGKIHPDSLGTGGIASSPLGATVESSSSIDAQASAQLDAKVDAVQVDAPVTQAENVEGPIDIDNN